jgi:hypothetical protein
MKGRAPAWFVLGALLASGCVDQGPCTLVVEPVVMVWISDSVSGGPRAGEARGWIQEGSQTDSLIPGVWSGSGVMLARQAYARFRTFTVAVNADGYAPWQRTGVRSRSDHCGVIPVRVDARLVPLP